MGSAFGQEVRIEKALDRDIRLDASDLAGLAKMPVDIFDNQYLDQVKPDALILCIDIRDFSKFLRDNDKASVFELIKNFTSNFLSCVNQFGLACDYYKLLGDGAIVIWDETTDETIAEALQVFDTFLEFANEELFTPYDGLGFGGALVTDMVFKYEISAETSRLKYRDYVGYGINLACRIQALARCNELVINCKLAKSGKVPFVQRDLEDYRDLMSLLKGLKEEDCSRVLFYTPQASCT
ncbi:MAG: adenylate/guanylate cyclase domain-containing protein [Spirochaetales bacterium]|nr:adenylate/guanylate cyclase domain-containing protein [Spirochaetales bacterium]